MAGSHIVTCAVYLPPHLTLPQRHINTLRLQHSPLRRLVANLQDNDYSRKPRPCFALRRTVARGP